VANIGTVMDLVMIGMEYFHLIFTIMVEDRDRLADKIVIGRIRKRSLPNGRKVAERAPTITIDL